jgi:hypothetical protein
MKKIFLFVLVLASAGLQAQHHKFEDFMPQSVLGIGVSFQNFDGLNSRIANFDQYKQLKDQTGTLQLGWLKERKRIVSGFNLSGGTGLSGSRGKKSSNMRYIGLGGDIGYSVIKNKQAMLYPFAGLGYQWYQARFYKDNSSVPFDEVLQSPNVQNDISALGFKNEFFTYRLGIGIILTSPKHPSGGIGLQAGYSGSFQERAWTGNENQTLGNAPKDGLSQFFISLVFTHKPMMMKHH